MSPCLAMCLKSLFCFGRSASQEWSHSLCMTPCWNNFSKVKLEKKFCFEAPAGRSSSRRSLWSRLMALCLHLLGSVWLLPLSRLKKSQRQEARAEQDQQGRGQGDHENLPQAQTSRTGFVILSALLSSVSKVGQTFDNIPPCFRLAWTLTQVNLLL